MPTLNHVPMKRIPTALQNLESDNAYMVDGSDSRGLEISPQPLIPQGCKFRQE